MIFRNQKGIALIIVLGSLLILSTIAVEFAYNSHIAYEIASSERERLQAYYLARSGLQLIKLELKVENQLRSQYAGLLQNLQGSGVTSDPLCKQLPLSTGLLKGISTGSLLGKSENGGTEEGQEKPEGEKGEKAQAKEVVAETVAESGEFLNFKGDFEVACDTEERKINLNMFWADPSGQMPAVPPPAATGGTRGGGTPVQPPAVGGLQLYEEQKNVLFSLLTQKEFEKALGDKAGKPDEIRKIVNAIADWADRDDRINEAPGVSGSAEASEYTGSEYHYKVKNGKYTSTAELLLVAGVTDDLYQKMAPQITVYGDNKVNLCQASDEIVKAFVWKAAQAVPGSINPNDEAKWTAILESVRMQCDQPSPTPSGIAGAIANAVGLSSSGLLANQITTKNRFYRIESTGSVGDNRVRIIGVLDTGQANPNLWKTLYFRVE